MASLYLVLCIVICTCLVAPIPTSSQAPPTPTPSIASCASSLLPLTPCAPFVQGSTPLPLQSCCDNLKLLYFQQPNCLCLLLSDAASNTFPINRTLALQLPQICDTQINLSDCAGVPHPPTSQVSSGSQSNSTAGSKTNSTIAAASSPMVQVPPRPTMQFGFGRSASDKLKTRLVLGFMALVTRVIFLD